VAACGVCHTDLHYLDHGVKTFRDPPLILGHEASGVVEALGGGVRNLRRGDRVLIPAVVSCGSCLPCRRGRGNLCDALEMFGNHRDGAYAEYVTAPARELFIVPGEIPLEEAAIIADAVSTPYHAVKNRARVRPGDKVAVFGCGGVGIHVVQCAAAAGAVVIAVDLVPERLGAALEMGASETVQAGKDVRADKAVRALTAGAGADIVFEAVGRPDTIRAAFASVRKGGRLCVIGYSAEEASLAMSRLMFYELELVGSLGCPASEYPELIDLVRRGRIRIAPLVTAKLPLERIGEAFDALRKGRGFRSIVVPGKG
jgi:6-hydroxycyclohex-1-ene-1-carbonyl-CoA dehydrogenase